MASPADPIFFFLFAAGSTAPTSGGADPLAGIRNHPVLPQVCQKHTKLNSFVYFETWSMTCKVVFLSQGVK